jgi:type IV pilus assembly protein PilA
MTRIRRSLDRNDSGFTLIELLVVIIIIGILAAIAIPVFLNQRQKGYDAAAKSDLHNAALAEESYLAGHGAYTDVQTLSGSESVGLSKGTTLISIYVDSDKGFCLASLQAGGSPLPTTQAALAGMASSILWWYDSQAGGLQPRSIPIGLTPPYSLGCPSTNASSGASFSLVQIPST